MNNAVKKCARPECGKTVYPLEELKCLDKIWHKLCFKCSVCGMALSMKNYKGYEKMPYCDAHYPKTVASACNDTPEMRRLAENTKNQSMAKYHADFEKQKGTKSSIVDDPELARHRKNMQVASNVAYHGELERKQHMEDVRPPIMDDAGRSVNRRNGSIEQATSVDIPVQIFPAYNYQQPPPQRQTNNGAHHANGQPPPHHQQPRQDTSPYSAKMQQASTLVYSSDQGGMVAPQPHQQDGGGGGRAVGSIADYDPLNGAWGSATAPQPTHHGMQPPPADGSLVSPSASSLSPSSPSDDSPGAFVGYAPARVSVSDNPFDRLIREVDDSFAFLRYQPQPPMAQPNAPRLSQQQEMQQSRSSHQQPAPPPSVHRISGSSGVTLRAIYDYTAADTDEVTFVEGDLIVNSQSVDEGWMTGTVQRTNQWGMLPANYVERAM